jgi:ABC-type transporter MlaC component
MKKTSVTLLAVSWFLVSSPLVAEASDSAPAPASEGASATANAPGSAGAPAGTSHTQASKKKEFTGEAKVLEKRMEELFDYSRKVNAAGAEGKEAKAKVEGSLDWERVAEDCLGHARWKKTSEKNRTEFRNLLRQVVIKTAYSRFDTFWKGTTYQFQKIEVTGNDSHVVSSFIVGGDAFDLEYYLEHKGGNWLIYDIGFEGVRYSKNINEQLDAFLKDKGFPNLLTQLKKRLEELDEAQHSEKGR